MKKSQNILQKTKLSLAMLVACLAIMNTDSCMSCQPDNIQQSHALTITSEPKICIGRSHLTTTLKIDLGEENTDKYKLTTTLLSGQGTVNIQPNKSATPEQKHEITFNESDSIQNSLSVNLAEVIQEDDSDASSILQGEVTAIYHFAPANETKAMEVKLELFKNDDETATATEIIKWSAISELSDEETKNLTTAQLGSLTDQEEQSLTDAQVMILSDEQTNALSAAHKATIEARKADLVKTRPTESATKTENNEEPVVNTPEEKEEKKKNSLTLNIDQINKSIAESTTDAATLSTILAQGNLDAATLESIEKHANVTPAQKEIITEHIQLLKAKVEIAYPSKDQEKLTPAGYGIKYKFIDMDGVDTNQVYLYVKATSDNESLDLTNVSFKVNDIALNVVNGEYLPNLNPNGAEDNLKELVLTAQGMPAGAQDDKIKIHVQFLFEAKDKKVFILGERTMSYHKA